MSELTYDNVEEFDEQVGWKNRVKILRERLGLTQEEFAEKICVSTNLISAIERGQKKLTLKNAIRIMYVFNVDVGWILAENDNENDTASNIIDNLRNVFKIDFENRTISVDEDMAEFLDKLFNAYKIKEEKGMPSEALKYWIDGIKNEYNEKIKKRDMFDTNKIIPKYYLQDYKEHKEESATHIPF